jgi:signal transduction histidine kinase
MGRKLLFFILLVSVIGIGVLHFTTPADLIFYHNTYRRLSYFPIVLGGLWFGIRGGVILAIFSSIAFIPHLLLFVGNGLQSYYSELTEIVLYLAAGALVGLIAGRERKLHQRIQLTSARLAQSYDDLFKGTQQLIEAEEQLKSAQKMSVLGEMSATLAHEIKNPLSSIQGTAEILLEDIPEGHPKREFADILLKETARLNTTLENVLNYAANSPAKRDPGQSLLSVITQQKGLIAPLLKSNSVDFELDNLEDGANYMVDGARMSQVFLNILINSIEAMEHTAQPLLRVNFSRNETGCQVDIHDNGPGINEELKKAIFKPFYTTKESGTGLGLLISRKIVESHGGTINISDSHLGGACFSIYLPEKSGTYSLKKYITAGKEDHGKNTDH